MKVVKQSAKVLMPETPMKHIEKIGRICYKSEERIADGTDKKFVNQLFKSNHHAMLEHYRFIMQVNPVVYGELSKIAPRHMEFSSYNDRLIISCNARALLELHENCRCLQFGYIKFAVKNLRDELIGHILRKYDCHELFGFDRNAPLPLLSTAVDFIENSPSAMCEEEWKIHGWMSVHMITDRGISHEIVRHREETSFAQESTRYCNYSADKHGNEITVIDQGFEGNEYFMWEEAVSVSERMYNNLTKLNVKPQMARSVLPTCLKTEIVMTAPMFEWEHYFNLRMRGTTGAPHPLIKDLSIIAYDEMMEVFFNESDKN